jgi:hypothetical protein
VKRVYHHFERWEEITAGMWRNVPVGERQAYIDNAAALMKDPQAFFLAMHKAQSSGLIPASITSLAPSTGKPG